MKLCSHLPRRRGSCANGQSPAAAASAGVVSGTRSVAEPQAGGGNMAVTAAQTETRIRESGTYIHTLTQAALCEQRRSVSSLNRLPPTTRRTRSPKHPRVDFY